MSHVSNSQEPLKLERRLGLFDSTMIMIGIVIGSGIFLTSGLIARALPSAPLLLLAWIVGGLLTLAGALTYAELGAAFPQAGGQYVYLREAYGPMAGFLFGWISFLVYMTGGTTALALAFSEYLGFFFPELGPQASLIKISLPIFGQNASFTLSAGHIIAILIILLLSGVNYVGVALGKLVQNIITVIKLLTMGGLIVLGFTLGRGRPIDWTLNPGGFSCTQLLVGFGVALVAVSFAFDGWNNVNFVAGEIRNPQRNLPRALILGSLTITGLYALINIVYLYALPIPEMSGVMRIAEKATGSLFGTSTSAVISAMVLVSVFGALNGSILVGPRIYYAMSRDGLFFKKAAVVHPRFRTPGFSILIQAIWASILALAGSFEQIFTFSMFMAIVFWIAATAAVFTLRRKRPALNRPYKTWGYPVVPALFILASAGILLNTLLESPVEALAGIALTGLGVPVYFAWRRRNFKGVPHDGQTP